LGEQACTVDEAASGGCALTPGRERPGHVAHFGRRANGTRKAPQVATERYGPTTRQRSLGDVTEALTCCREVGSFYKKSKRGTIAAACGGDDLRVAASRGSCFEDPVVKGGCGPGQNGAGPPVRPHFA